MTDLHSHSTCSDGTFTPAEMLSLAEEAGLTLFSITDHDHIDAYESICDPAVRGRFSGKLITGTEITCILRGQTMEILGYGYDPAKLEAYIASKRRPPVFPPRELQMLYKAYLERGVRLDWPMERYSKEEFVSPKRMLWHQLKHPDNKKFFLNPENQENMSGYYRQELYNPESPLYVDYTPLFGSPWDAVDAIHAAGGLAFLAHCYQYTEVIYDHLEEIIKELPLDGLECWYSTFTEEQSAYLEQFCETHGLLMSGGSDFHGGNRPGTKLGTGNEGALKVKTEKVLSWAEKYVF